jgi:hypothetical protein
VDDRGRDLRINGTLRAVTLQSFEYRDPGEVVAEVMRRHEVHEGDTYLALVHEPNVAQEVVHTTYVPHSDWVGFERGELAHLLCERAQAMPIPDWSERGSPRHSIMTIAFRRGLTVFGADEALWLDAWMFSNHLMCAFSGGMILVTEHGWADFMTELGGATPALNVDRSSERT